MFVPAPHPPAESLVSPPLPIPTICGCAQVERSPALCEKLSAWFQPLVAEAFGGQAYEVHDDEEPTYGSEKYVGQAQARLQPPAAGNKGGKRLEHRSAHRAEE